MIKYALLFLLPFSLLNASKILSYNIYDRTDRADVMITFDTPYNGVIKQSSSESKIIIKLSDASIESSKFKKTDSNFLHSIEIQPTENQTQLIAVVPPNTALLASKTSDSYGLRLRFVNKTLPSKNSQIKTQAREQNPLSDLPTKKDDNMSSSYYIVVTILVIGILILFAIKKKILLKNSSNSIKNDTWLFKENEQTRPRNATATKQNENQISIRFQKALDDSNSVVMLDFAGQSYLVLMGKSNILLDKFTDNKPSTQEDFESILQNRHEELESFLNSDSAVSHQGSQEALQAYKERAASMIYES